MEYPKELVWAIENPPQCADQVPMTLFWGLTRAFSTYNLHDRYNIEEGSCTSDIAGIALEPGAVPTAWISLTDLRPRMSRLPATVFRLWDGKPEQEAGLVFAGRQILSVRGGPHTMMDRDAKRGKSYGTNVAVEFETTNGRSILSRDGRNLMLWSSLIVDLALDLSIHVISQQVSQVD